MNNQEKVNDIFNTVKDFGENFIKKIGLKDHTVDDICVSQHKFSFEVRDSKEELWQGRYYEFPLTDLDKAWNQVCENYKKEQAARKKALAQERKQILELRKNPEVKKYLKLMNEI